MVIIIIAINFFCKLNRHLLFKSTYFGEACSIVQEVDNTVKSEELKINNTCFSLSTLACSSGIDRSLTLGSRATNLGKGLVKPYNNN